MGASDQRRLLEHPLGLIMQPHDENPLQAQNNKITDEWQVSTQCEFTQCTSSKVPSLKAGTQARKMKE